MATDKRDDVDLAPAAEQSSEVDEAQEGDAHRRRLRRRRARPRRTRSRVDEHDEGDRRRRPTSTAALDAIAEAVDDPEADAVVDDALDIDAADEAEAAVEATDDEADGGRGGAEDDASAPTPSAEAEQSGRRRRGRPTHRGRRAADDVRGRAAEVDPYEAFRNELRGKPGKWYVIHSYAGFESRVKQNIENRMVSMTMEDYIYQVEVPMEDVVEIKNGQRKLVTRVRIPGYVLVRMDLNEDSWSVVRHTPGVTGFVGNAHNPTPLRFEEAFYMLKSLVADRRRRSRRQGPGPRAASRPQRVIPAEVDFEIGETITIKEGSFAGLPGYDQRDQARERQAHGARLAVRARDAGRAQLRPGHQALVAGASAPSDTPRFTRLGLEITGARPRATGRARPRPRPARTPHEGKEQWHRRRRSRV